MTLRVLDLFSGIGGFSLGLERTGGFRTVAFCEIEPFCRKVLAKHWPEVPCYDDVQTLTAERLAADGIAVDVICGGFPCQDISVAGKGAGLEGERSGLWSEYARIVGELRPQFVIVENVAALLSRGLDRVLGDLASLGFDAEWHCIPASAVGAPHRRDRIWIVAYTSSKRCGKAREYRRMHAQRIAFSSQVLAHSSDDRVGRWEQQSECCKGERHVADAACNGWPEGCEDSNTLCVGESGDGLGQLGGICSTMANSGGSGLSNSLAWRLQQEIALSAGNSWWFVEPDVGRVAHGISDRVHRLKGLGNAVVPQIPELIGNAILASLKQTVAACANYHG